MTPRHLITLERSMQIALATMCALGTILLGMGEHNVTLPVLAVVVAASSVYFTDVKGWIRLNPILGNTAAILALLLAAYEFRFLEREDRLLAMANLMVYLQFVLMYKEKNVHTYWLLVVASLLQVAVACALNLSMWFGLLLVVYLVIALVATGLFYLVREHALHGARSETAATWRPAPRRWGWFSRRLPQTFGREMPVPAGRSMVLELARQVSFLASMALVLALFCFLVMPRIGQQEWRPTNMPLGQAVVGYSDEVTLGEVGDIAEDPTVVMQLWLTDVQSDEIYRLAEEPLIRGTSLSQYMNGKWGRGRLNEGISGFPPLPEDQRVGLVRQRISVEPLDNQTLFCIAPPVADRPDRRLEYNAGSGQMTRKGPRGVPIQYELLTAGLRSHFHVSVLPSFGEFQRQRRRDGTIDEGRGVELKHELLQLPPSVNGVEPLAGLRSIAEQVVEDIPEDDRVRRCKQLEYFLRSSGQFSYTLGQVERGERDPIEDFVMRSRQGHCEYFASALTLMLRSVGIPARMVLGFRGGTWNTVGQYYQIEQLHAHTWVEAYLEPEQLPEVLHMPSLWQEWCRGTERQPGTGGWLQLDPTPAGDVEEDEVAGYGLYVFGQAYDYMQFLWANYVLGMDAQRQQESVYAPLADGAATAAKSIMHPSSWRAAWEQIVTWLDPRNLRNVRVSWQTGLVTFVVLWALVGLVKLLRWMIRWLRRGWIAGRAVVLHHSGGVHVEFYSQLERLLENHALKRSASQTPLEFAREAGGRLADAPQTVGVAAVPRWLTERYYQVRFGRRPLDNQQQQAVEQALLDLAGALQQRQAAAQG